MRRRKITHRDCLTDQQALRAHHRMRMKHGAAVLFYREYQPRRSNTGLLHAAVQNAKKAAG